MADIQYDPACVDCRREAGKDIAGTAWQCTGHIRAEHNWLRVKLANAMVEWEHDVEVLTKERNAALKLSEQRGAAYDIAWQEAERLRERLDQFEAAGFPNVATVLDRVAATEPGAGGPMDDCLCCGALGYYVDRDDRGEPTQRKCDVCDGRGEVALPPPPAQDADSAVALLLAVWDAWHRVGYEPEETIDEVINRVGDWRWNNGFDEFNPPTKPVPPWPGIRERDEEIASLRAELAEWTEARQRFAADRARLDASLAPRPAQDAVREAAELAHLDLLSYDEAVTGNEKRHALLRCKNALRDVLRTIDAALDAAKGPK